MGEQGCNALSQGLPKGDESHIADLIEDPSAVFVCSISCQEAFIRIFLGYAKLLHIFLDQVCKRRSPAGSGT